MKILILLLLLGVQIHETNSLSFRIGVQPNLTDVDEDLDYLAEFFNEPTENQTLPDIKKLVAVAMPLIKDLTVLLFGTSDDFIKQLEENIEADGNIPPAFNQSSLLLKNQVKNLDEVNAQLEELIQEGENEAGSLLEDITD